jgi:PAS domain S-box-containing protein
MEFEQPIPTDGAEDEQIDLFYRHGYLAECNDTMAQMYGYGRAEEIVGVSMDDLLPRSIPENVEYLRSAVRSGYRLTDAESHETDKEGNPKYFLNNLAGIVEAGFLIRAWGTQRDITERKRAEEALRESEERFRATFHQAAVGVAHVGLDGRWLRVNERLSEIVGYPREELLGLTFQDITYPEDLEMDLDYVRRLLAGEIDTYSVEKRYLRKDGSLVWINLTASLMRAPAGEPVYFIAVIEDITERKRAEEALRESETRYRTLVERVPAITYIEALDSAEEPEWNMLYVSPQVETLVGYSPQEWVANPDLWSRLLHPEDRERVLAEDARTERTGELFSSEYRLLARDGTIVWIRDEAVLVRDGAGEPLFWQGIMFDITGSKLAEEALLQSEERYRAVVEQSTEGIYLLDAETKRILEANPALRQMLGYAGEELLGMEVYDLIAHPREDVDSNLQRTLKEGRRFVGERKYRHKDGSLVDMEVGVSVIRYGGRKVVCAVVRNITERKRSEEALREVREAERSRIARDLHDDILQDIVYALQEIQIMQVTSENGGNAALEDTAEALRRSVEGLRGAIFELRLKERRGRSFVSSLEILLDLNRRMARNRYELELDVEDGFPRMLSEKASQELTRIIQEALTNARRHSEARRVEVRLWRAGDLVCAEVADDGRGFDAAQTGVGMGQHSMRHRALELGGELQVESEPGRGTRVRFHAPLSRLIEE